MLEGKNVIKDPALGEYYDKIALVTRGRVFTWNRFVTIAQLHLGSYDHLLEGYRKEVAVADAKALAERPAHLK